MPAATLGHPDIDTFLDAVWLEEGLAANTLAAYRRDLTAFAAWLHGENVAINAAARHHIEAWFAARHKDSRASTANRRLAALRRYYGWALRTGRAHTDPCLALRAARRLSAGTVWVNRYGRTGDFIIPTGGFKGSGIGKDLGRQAFEANLQTKSVLIDF